MRISSRILAIVGCFTIASPAAALPGRGPSAAVIKAIDQMMAALGSQSTSASAAIRQAYAPQLGLLALDGYADLEGALATGRLAPLPRDPIRFNVRPRLDGLHPIGEMDLNILLALFAGVAAALSPLRTRGEPSLCALCVDPRGPVAGAAS